MNKKKYMELAIDEAIKAKKNGDVPIGAVIVCNDKIISKGYNKKEKNHIATEHAEIIAINKACKKMKSWRLDNCTLFVTMEPCMMCCGAIFQSRIKNVIYGVKNEKFGCSKISNKSINFEEGYCDEKYLKMIQEFFYLKRK